MVASIILFALVVLLGGRSKQNPPNTPVSSPGEQPTTEPVPVGQSVTVQGTTYNNVEVRNVYPRSLFVRHAGGTAFIDRLEIDPKDATLLGVEPIKKSSASETQVVSSSKLAMSRPAPTPVSRSPQSDKPAAPGLVRSAPSLSRNVFDEVEEAALAAKVAAPAHPESRVTFTDAEGTRIWEEFQERQQAQEAHLKALNKDLKSSIADLKAWFPRYAKVQNYEIISKTIVAIVRSSGGKQTPLSEINSWGLPEGDILGIRQAVYAQSSMGILETKVSLLVYDVESTKSAAEQAALEATYAREAADSASSEARNASFEAMEASRNAQQAAWDSQDASQTVEDAVRQSSRRR